MSPTSSYHNQITLAPTGLAPQVQYVFKPGFGEVPAYLVQHQAERAAQAAAEAAAADAPKVPSFLNSDE